MCFSGKYSNGLLEEAGVPKENSHKHREKHANATQKGPGQTVKSGLLL